jgi:hypothetical protein
VTVDPKILDLQKKADQTTEANLKLFDINAFQVNSETTLEATVEGVGVIKYRNITISDLFDLTVKSRNEYTAKIIWVMMNKADPAVTYEKVCKMPPDVASRIFEVLSEKALFLPLTKSES